MIDLNNFIVKESVRCKNGKKYIDRCKYFLCKCPTCGKSKGYQTKHRYSSKPNCVKCATSDIMHKNTLREKHWSKTGKYSPKKYITHQQIEQKKERELAHKRKYGKEYYQKNKNYIHSKRKEFERKNINYKLASRLRTRLNQAVKEKRAFGSAIKDLGCSIDDLKKHLEAQFKLGMNWDNYGRDGWHIDHIEPLSKFDLSDPEQLQRACHYGNLQPLWATENLAKGSK